MEGFADSGLLSFQHEHLPQSLAVVSLLYFYVGKFFLEIEEDETHGLVAFESRRRVNITPRNKIQQRAVQLLPYWSIEIPNQDRKTCLVVLCKVIVNMRFGVDTVVVD